MKLIIGIVRLLKLPVFFLILFGIPSTSLNAQTVFGTPSSYTVQILDVSICTAVSCATSTSVYSGTALANIAALTAGQVASATQGGVSIPPGTYTHIRIQVDREIGVLGRISGTEQGGGQFQKTAVGDADCITTSTTVGTQDTDGSFVAKLAGAPGTTNFTIPVINGVSGNATVSTAGNTLSIVAPFTTALAVTAGSTLPQFGITFDVANGVGATLTSGTTCNVQLGSPTIKITVGGAVIATINIV